MAILSIKHVTTYRYHRPVAFGAHRMMLRPRDDDDQRVLQAELAITPEPKELVWKRDRLGNHVAISRFAEQSDELRFTSHVRLDHASKEFRPADIEQYASNYPFSYSAEDWPQLRRFILPVPLHADLRRWGDQFFRADGSAGTHPLLAVC